MKPISERRLRHEANLCASSREPLRRCHCRCGGELHGQWHSDQWIAAELFRDRTAMRDRPDSA